MMFEDGMSVISLSLSTLSVQLLICRMQFLQIQYVCYPSHALLLLYTQMYILWKLESSFQHLSQNLNLGNVCHYLKPTNKNIQSTSVNHMDITKAAFQNRNNNISISTKLTLHKLFMQATAFYRSWGSCGAHCHSSADFEESVASCHEFQMVAGI
jgi:hypothetical protein